METKLERLLDWLNGRPAPPTILHVHLTNRCNLNCLICPRRGGTEDYSTELSSKQWLDIFEQSKALGVARWEIVGGGEPLMRGDLFKQLITKIKTAGMEGFLITNGTLLTGDIAKQLVTSRWENITVSLDSCRAEVHDSLKDVTGAFTKAVANIRYLVELRQRSGDRYPHLRMNTVFGNSNYDHLAEIFEFGIALGFNEFSFQPVQIHHNDGAQIALKPEYLEQIQSTMRLIAKRAGELGIPTNARQYITDDFIIERPENKETSLQGRVPESEVAGTEFPCFEPWYLMVLHANGQALPCRSYKGEAEFVQERGLQAIWSGEVFNRVRHELTMGKMPWYCRHCAVGQIVEDLRVRSAIKAYQTANRQGS